MARIITYTNDSLVTHSDKWIGTDIINGVTKNFQASDIGFYLNNFDVLNIFGSATFKFIDNINTQAGRGRGSITLENGGGDNTTFESFENFKISKYSSYNSDGGELKDISDYLEHIYTDNDIIIFNANNLNKFGKFKADTFELDTNDNEYYNFQLTFEEGFGTIEDGEYYALFAIGFFKDGSDKQFEYNQETASATWVIEHNLEKFPSVTVLDSAGNIVLGEISFDSNNQITITFSSPFSGVAYLN